MEKEKLIKDTNFIVIQGWMVNHLKLMGTELVIYACIYSFSQDGNSEFSGSLQYLADWSGISKPGVLKCLDKLLSKKLIIKNSITKNGITYNVYKANLDMLTTVNGVNYSERVLTTVNGHSPQLTNNIVYNIDNKKEYKRKYIKEKSDYWTKIYNDRNFCNPLQYGYGLSDPNEPKLSDDEIF